MVSFFTRALKTFQLSQASFSVLCTLPAASPPPSEPRPSPPRSPPRTLIVLDSSFNPPTLAHQGMALSALEDEGGRHAGAGTGPDDPEAATSRVLLLLAINNADKAPKPAVFPQRLAMMYLFALDLLSAPTTTAQSPTHATPAGVDIAVTTEPYFHSKASAVGTSEFYHGAAASSPRNDSSIRSNAATAPSPAMIQVYLTGYDTLIRIFDAKYYPGGGMRAALDPLFARARLRVTTRPDADWGDAAAQAAYLAGLRAGRLEAVGGRREWAERVEMVEGGRQQEAGGEGEAISSTKVRAAVVAGDWDGLKKLVSEDVAEWIRREGLYKE
jgi:nicotinamide-nucleotide adenylyltransferase